MKSFFIALEFLVVILVIAVVVFAYSGIYNIAATDAHFPAVSWFLNTTMERSVKERAEEVELSRFYEDADLEDGFRKFDEMCVMCHGAPGVEPSSIGKGLNPDPPELSEEAEEWTPEQVYWIIKHGIKMAGMPAFGPTHSEKDLWILAAFVKELPEISPQEYQEMKNRIPAEGNHHHEDGHGDSGESKKSPEERTL